MRKREEILYQKVTKKGLNPKHVAEVGVYLPQNSNIAIYAKRGINSTFVEPDPNSIEAIKDYFGNMNNITIHPVAIFDESGKVELVQRQASTYLKVLDSSPAIVNDEYKLDDKDTFVVDAVTFDKIDDGSIDLLSIDIEGGEWFVLKHMRSRPLVLSIETHGAMYTNPYISEIESWIEDNNYIVWYMDGSDTVYVKKGAITINVLDRLTLYFTKANLWYKKKRKETKRRIKKLLKK